MSSPVPGHRGTAAGRVFGAGLARTLYAARRRGHELVPATGPVLLVSNHSGFLDGPLVYCMAPRPLHFLVKSSYFDSPFGVLLRGTGQIPIDQNTGDRAALTAARAVLTRGGAVGIFPEGTRGAGDVQSVQQGAAWLALQTKVPIVPIATLGTRGTGGERESWPRLRSHLEVVFGEPFRIDEQQGTGREKLRGASDLLREKLAQHVIDAVALTGMSLPGDEPAKLE